MKLKAKLLTLFLLYTFAVFGQDFKRCGQEIYQAELEKSYEYRAKRLLRKGRGLFMKPVQLRNNDNSCADYVVKTIVHYTGVKDTSCAIITAQKQIDILNAGFALKDKNFDKWELFKNRFNIEPKASCIKFRLDSVVFHNDFKSYRSDYQETFNVFVADNIGDGILGYSALGADYGDGVAHSLRFWDIGGCEGLGSAEPYGLGKTLIHEVGHYISINHIWGNGCSIDDGIGDTPNQENPNYGCNVNALSCESNDMFMNYMDYSDDRCMFLFSPKQVDLMEEYLSLYLPNLLELDLFTNDSIFTEPQDTILTPIDSVLSSVDTNVIDTSLTPIDTVISPVDTTVVINPPNETVSISLPRFWWAYLLTFGLIGLFVWFVVRKR